jgi:hypothetical protein
MHRDTQQLARALEIFISRNTELQRYLENFHVHPGGLNIPERREAHARDAFARAAEDRGTTVEDYALTLIARTPAELEQLRSERRHRIATKQESHDLVSE